MGEMNTNLVCPSVVEYQLDRYCHKTALCDRKYGLFAFATRLMIMESSSRAIGDPIQGSRIPISLTSAK